jgi:hypothetical protein
MVKSCVVVSGNVVGRLGLVITDRVHWRVSLDFPPSHPVAVAVATPVP